MVIRRKVMSILFSFSMYFVSFLPLWLSVVFIDIKSIKCNGKNIWTEKISVFGIIIIFLICIIFIILWLRLMKGKEGNETGEIISGKENRMATSEFLLSYVLPLCAFDFTHWDGVILFAVFFITLFGLHVRHNFWGMNIIMEVLGYKLYECSIVNDDGVEVQRNIVSKRNLSNCKGEPVITKSINNDFKLDIR